MPDTIDLSAYDVIWDTPSENASGSMPIGNGDLAANGWVEPNGDVLLLIAKGDAWDENSSLVKLGRIRVRMDPPLPVTTSFLQRLSVVEAAILITAGTTRLRVWVDANVNVIRVEVDSSTPTAVDVMLETWRNYPYTIVTQTGDMFKNLTGKDPYKTWVTPDTILAGGPGEIVVCHHNEPRADDPFEINLRLQGLGGFREQLQHPLTDRTFGMTIRGDGFVSVSPRHIRHAADLRQTIEVHALASYPSTIAQWQVSMAEHVANTPKDSASAFAAHSAGWQAFWDRSHVAVTSVADSENARNITRAYGLQRYMNAAAGCNEFPIKHNGSLFTVGRPWDPDFRRWGGPGFWFMNQRLIYWPMLADGDFDMMRPWLAMYRKTLPLQLHRTKTYFGHGGAHFPETMTFWGTEVSGHYGWTPFEQRERPEAECAYLTYYWSGAVELVLILSEFVAHTNEAAMLEESLVPIANAVTAFYDEHYPREANGQLRFEPAQALETWHKAIDPMPEVAGLRYTLTRLLSLGVTLPNHLVERCRRILNDLPPLPVGERDGKSVLLPAAVFDIKKNTENPELYCVFPYRLFGVGKPEIDLAKRTFARRLHVEQTCWHQDVIQMALLGMTAEAKDFLSQRAGDKCHSDSRFPAFWNAFHDWIPDIDHGGVLQLALQFMLVQCDGPKIHLLPAWPAEWDVSFKLHLPGPAVIEGTVRAGRLASLAITPETRRTDIVVGPDAQPLAKATAGL